MKYITLQIILILSLSCSQNTLENKKIENPIKIIEEKIINIDDLPLEESICPADMKYVIGEYCTNLRHKCLEKMDRKRCIKYDNKPTCLGKEINLSFCMDEEEYTKSNKTIPVHNVDWTKADNLCKNEGKRLCNNQEWALACEGPERLAYSYGWERNSDICNIDIHKNLGRVGNLVDHTCPITEFKQCISPFGVHNMNGNVTEWVQRVGGKKPWRSGLMGGWWGPVKSECRPLVTNHFEYYRDKQVGFRCCKNAERR